MKKILSFVSLVLTALFLLTCFTACKKPEQTDEPDEDMVAFDINDYQIIRPQSVGSDLSKATVALQNRIESSAKVTLVVSDDWYDEGEDVSSKKEILIGETDRAETAAAKAKLDEINNKKAFIIEVNVNKIVILGKSEDITIRAIKYFATNFVSTSAKEGTLAIDASYSALNKANTDTIIYPENLVEFSMGAKHTVYSHGDRYSTSTLQYPTAIYLQYQRDQKNNGTMIATLNSSEQFYRIFKSTDDGKNWAEISQVFETNPENLGNKELQAGRMPFLYELPVDMGDLKKGTIILAGTSSPVGGTNAKYEKTAITMYYSTDLGETWNYLPSVDYGEGQVDGNGVWEPFLIYEEETGRLYCFYSDATEDAVEGKHDQKLVYKYTTDRKTWVGAGGKTAPTDDPFEAVASSNHKHRPGMVVVSKMTNGEYILTYEFVGSKMDSTNSTTYYKIAKRLDDWGDPADTGYIVKSDKGETAGSGPWSAYTPVGGDNGIFFTFARFRGDYKHLDTSSNLNAPDIFISFDYGRTYTTLKNPFKYTHIADTQQDRTGYSVMFLVSPDGRSVYFFNNPPYGITTQEISVIRIDIIP